MLPAVLLSLGPGGQAAFGIVVYHGGGEAVVPVKADDLPVHVGKDLVHIQGEVRQLVPIHRALVPETGQQVGQIVHIVSFLSISFIESSMVIVTPKRSFVNCILGD